MHRLQSPAPVWLTLFEAVRILMAPIGPRAHRAASRAVRAQLAADAGDLEEAGDVFSGALIREGLRDWEGIGDHAGEPLALPPPTPPDPDGARSQRDLAIDAFLADPDLFAAADRLYVSPFVERGREKNASSPSPTGTSAAATADRPTAETAQSGAATAPTKRTRSRA